LYYSRSNVNTVFFWIAWFLISAWVLRTFYFSFDKKKIDRLKLTSFGIDLSALILFFFPWLPLTMGAWSAWQLILRGDLLLLFLLLLVVSAGALFLTNEHTLLKLGASLHIAASIFFFVPVIRLMPDTVTITWHSVAPIVVSLLLLTGNVFVLMLWHQLQLKEKGKRSHKRK